MKVFKTLNKRPSLLRAMLILLMAIIEVGSIYLLLKKFGSYLYQELPSELKGHGIWTFVALLISAPIAFLVWKFRDENTVHQLENQRKDVNLKEFQKIAEWVSGLHLVEDKIVEKTKKIEKATENNPLEQGGNQEKKTDTTLETETSREYGQAGTSRHIPSHSRQDGAVGLQVAAVYMLKPFYCGEHGDGFRKPALNLLTSAWLALFKQVEDSKDNNQKLDPEKLENSPLAIALTEVLLADGGIHLRRYPEVFSNLYLPYLNLHLPRLDRKKLWKLFSKDLNFSGLNLENSYLRKAKLNGAKLNGAKLNDAKLYEAELNDAELNDAELNGAKLNGAELNGAELNGAELNGADLNGANLYLAELAEISIDNLTSWHGTAFDTENIQSITPYLDKRSLTWIIQVPKLAGEDEYRYFRFEIDVLEYRYRLPNSLTAEELQQLNPTWQVSLVEN